MDYQVSGGDVLCQPYEVLAKILDGILEVNKEERKKKEWNELLTLLDDLAN